MVLHRLTGWSMTRSLARLTAAAAVVAVVAAGGLLTPQAQAASYDSLTTEQRAIAKEVVDAGGVYKDPASISPEARAIYQAEQASEATRKTQMWRAMTVLRTNVRTLPGPPVVTLGAATFTAGVLIGTEIRKWLKIGVKPPAEIDPTSFWAGGRYSLLWTEAGGSYNTGAPPVPVDAYALRYDLNWIKTTTSWVAPGSGFNYCSPRQQDVPIPAGFWSPGVFNGGGHPCNAPEYPDPCGGEVCDKQEFYIEPDKLEQPEPLQPYNGQPYELSIPADSEPTEQEKDTRLRDWWEAARNKDARCWLQWQMDIEDSSCPGGGHEDPYDFVEAPHCLGATFEQCRQRYRERGFTTIESYTVPDEYENTSVPPRAVVANELAGHLANTKKPVRIGLNPRERCGLTDPTDDYVVGQAEGQWEPFPRFSGDQSGTFQTPLHPNDSTTTLRWGTTSFVGGDPRWDGFGYRHIAAKHGWSPADEAATDAALRTTPVPTAGGHDRWQFTGPDPYAGRGGVICRRVVIVDYGTAPGSTVPTGIITSYGKEQ